jgi:bleomycin hydrolase
MKIIRKSLLASLFFLFFWQPIAAQDKNETQDGYQFNDIKEVKYSSVKNQHRSGTCWSYSALAFLESEILRLGKPEFDLSEMYIVRHTYSNKATKYVRFHGYLNFGGGGAFYDVIETIRKYGIVPETIYPGLEYGEEMNVHGELDEVTKAYVDAVIKNRNRKLSTAWQEGYEGILDAYLGKVPKKFTFNGKEYTPETFSQHLGLNLDDYVYLTSFTHHPFYKKFILEVPDNWALGELYNLPLDELMQVFDYSINNGYSVAWASDVSEKGFAYKNGVAIVPDVNLQEMSDSEKSKWTELSQKEKDDMLYKFDKPGKEKVISQEERQTAFDNYETTDDHGMLIVGIANDQNGTKYYKVKNSWGTSDNYKGFFYASESYVRYKTISILVNKKSIPKEISSKLGI